MSKLISYSLFNAPCEMFERLCYIRNFYWNSRMNTFLYPDWRTHLELEYDMYIEYKGLFDWLVENNNLRLGVVTHNPQLCEGMLWRMRPIWTIDVSHVLCRDADAITTYREAQRIQAWLEGGKAVSALLDNPAHGGLMGGMVGFETSSFKAFAHLNSFDELIANEDLSMRGSDQNLLNRRIAPCFPVIEIDWLRDDVQITLPQVDPKLWESNLVTRHIGSAGVVEMEIIRFFKRFDEYQWKFDVIEKQFKDLFPWH